MSILHVRNVPPELYERIRRQAQAQNRSISAEVITLLERSLSTSATSQADLLESIRRRRKSYPPQGAPESIHLLHEDRTR
jgi:plasmid stability protein